MDSDRELDAEIGRLVMGWPTITNRAPYSGLKGRVMTYLAHHGEILSEFVD